MTKNRKIALAVLSVVLVAAIAIGATLAYMTKQTEQRANNFTFSTNSLNAKLTEPDWDGVKFYDPEDGVTPIYDYIDDDNDPETPDVPVYGYVDGDIQQPCTDKDNLPATADRPRNDGGTDLGIKYGDEESQNMIPGQVAPKNPVITNTGDKLDEWVAAKMTFVYGEGSAKAGQPLSAADLLKVTDVMTINYNSEGAGNWERMSGTATSLEQVFYYKSIVTKANETAPYAEGGKTAPIFTTVTLNLSATSEQVKALEDIGGFAIYIEGFAAQDDVADTYADFKTWAATGVVFENTPTTAEPADVAKPGIGKASA